MSTMERAHRVARKAGEGAPERVRLDYEGRFLRRRRLVAESGLEILVDLAETVSLDHGDALVLESGVHVGIVAAEEPLLAIAGKNLARLTWHIGNRHTPCRIEETRLLIREDPVLARMLEGLGATVEPISAPFAPEGGAYGHGRTLGHSHGEHADHTHGAHEH
ncbi:urease accessory protein UreE [Tropicimonas sp. IMCC6043]|uniref:urease accessory protein UreE n=1 Tax=Tropicimonas sp. IMCC6043 TaxID=2510645 RepID=UPI00101BE25B|nr:urease accessory protein UreE [Tropicimonas sp. IMCC6043]RYH10619.1 urease accessory protein UreE [Tropicimonas sp. IMCC6043]